MMARLIPLTAIGGLREIPLTKPEVTIGRSRQNDIQLEDPSVSRIHATLTLTDGDYVIEDSGSLHGITVNGKPVRRLSLSPNDVIQVGIYSLRFVTAEPATPEATSHEVRQVDHLQLLLDVTRVINSSLAAEEVLDRVIDAVIQVTRAERGFLMMLDSDNNLAFRVGRNFDGTALQTQGVTISGTVVEQVRRSGEPVVLSDASDSDAMGPQSVIQMGLKSVMCVPLKTHDHLIGLIYVDSHQRAKQFSDADLELFQSLANHAALAIEKSQLYEQLQAHSASLEEQVRARTIELVQAEKLATIGRLAAGIAHEINSPLAVLTANLNILEHLIRGPFRPDGAELMEDVRRSSAAAADRLHRIVKAFETFAGLDEAEFKAVDVNAALEELLDFAKHQIPDRVRIVKELSPLDPILCSPGRMHQALMNLLMNAVESIDGVGEVRLRTERHGDHIQVTIRDSGRGMTSEQLASIFDANFTRKRDRIGLSMGLLITAQVIRDHGGDIQIASKPGEGTTVTILLPVRTPHS
jgi:signal transduction histidine kinase